MNRCCRADAVVGDNTQRPGCGEHRKGRDAIFIGKNLASKTIPVNSKLMTINLRILYNLWHQ